MAIDSHATTTSNATDSRSGGWSSRRIAVTALFTAIAIVANFIEFPIFPAAAWLKYDPSGIVCLVSGLVFGPATGLVVSVLSCVRILFGNPWGALMAVIASVSLTVPAAAIYRRRRTRGAALAGMAVSVVVCLALCIVANIIVTPLYTGMPTEAVIALIVPALLPFNLLKIAINCVVSFLVYGTVERIVER